MSYFSKMKGTTQSPPRPGYIEIFLSLAGGFVGISVLGYINYKVLPGSDVALLFGPMGASAVLIFGVPKSPLAQPRNVLGGHVMSALIGVLCFKLFSSTPWFSSALAVSASIGVMHLTRAVHPPAGATALIAVVGDAKIHSLGFFYSVAPVGAGAAILILIGLIFNNIPRSRRYPEFWL